LDHTGANLELKTEGVQIVGPASETIPGRDVAVDGGDVFPFGSKSVRVLSVGGHTRGHIAYYFPDDRAIFVGDALFMLGCGRMFEGTPQQFWTSLQRLRALPDDTMVYCAHEYTLSNSKFALNVEPSNAALQQRVAVIQEQRRKNQATVPATLGLEKETNPFLRVDVSEEIRRQVGVVEGVDTDAVAFGKVRAAKDAFRG
jgi:hydroxyacylglutathione hydrolase